MNSDGNIEDCRVESVFKFETNCPDGQKCGAVTTGCLLGHCQRKGTMTCKHFLNLAAGESAHSLAVECPYCQIESLSAQVAELRAAIAKATKS
jgi:hypothetical protein